MPCRSQIFEEKTIEVDKAAEIKTGRIKETKTENSRTVNMPSSLVPVLKAHLTKLREKALKKGWGDPELLFPSDANTILDHDNVAKVFTRALKKAKLPRFRVYDLRHTSASFALAQGSPLTYVAAMMGDSNETVLRYYADWIDSDGMEHADLADGAGSKPLTPTAYKN